MLVEEVMETLSVGTPISTIFEKTSDALSLAFSEYVGPLVGLTATTSNAAEGIYSKALDIDSNKAVE